MVVVGLLRFDPRTSFSEAGSFPIRRRTASRTLACPLASMLFLRASMMLMTFGVSPLGVSISTSGARCSIFACTSSCTARAYSFGIFSGRNLPDCCSIRSTASFTASASAFASTKTLDYVAHRHSGGSSISPFLWAVMPTRCSRPCMMSWPTAIFLVLAKASPQNGVPLVGFIAVRQKVVRLLEITAVDLIEIDKSRHVDGVLRFEF